MSSATGDCQGLLKDQPVFFVEAAVGFPQHISPFSLGGFAEAVVAMTQAALRPHQQAA